MQNKELNVFHRRNYSDQLINRNPLEEEDSNQIVQRRTPKFKLLESIPIAVS